MAGVVSAAANVALSLTPAKITSIKVLFIWKWFLIDLPLFFSLTDLQNISLNLSGCLPALLNDYPPKSNVYFFLAEVFRGDQSTQIPMNTDFAHTFFKKTSLKSVKKIPQDKTFKADNQGSK